jgi:hypothetical protein
MADNPEKIPQRNDEIDLLDLFRRMGNGLKKMFQTLGTWIVISIVFMLKKWVWLALSVVLAVGLSFLLKYTAESFYTSEMIVSSNAVPANEIISYTNKLHTFCFEKNKAELANALGLEETKVDFVQDVEAFWVIDRGNDGIPDYTDYSGNHNVYDTVNVRLTDRLAINVKTTSPKELSEIRKGIFSFIEKNQLFQEQNRIRLAQNEDMLKRLNYDILQLDSLQKIKYFEESRNRAAEKGGQMIFLQEQKTQLIYDDIYQLYSRRQYFEKQKELFGDIITLLSDFTPPLKPENSGSYYAKILIPLFFGLCLLILILQHNRKKLFETYNKY